MTRLSTRRTTDDRRTDEDRDQARRPAPEQAHPVDPGVAALAQGKRRRRRRPRRTARDAEDPAKLRREAAGYRRRLRETEAEREKLRARLEQSDRADVERLVTGDGGSPNAEDFWLAVQLDDLRDEDGALDPAKVKAARDRVPRRSAALAQARSELRRRRSRVSAGPIRAVLRRGAEEGGRGARPYSEGEAGRRPCGPPLDGDAATGGSSEAPPSFRRPSPGIVLPRGLSCQ